VEVYNINSATYTYLTKTYGNKTYQDVVRADVISKGHTVTNTYINQTFSDVISRYSNAASSIGHNNITSGINHLTETLQTSDRSGTCIWFNSGSNYRYFYVNRTGTNPNNYTVEVYNINSTTDTYLTNTYGNKTYQDVVRADVISKGHTVTNTYANQTFSDVTSKYSNAASSIGHNNITSGINHLTETLQTSDRSGAFIWFYSGSNYRFFYVSQE
jgi:exosome complex RNA-binding protein Csl4